MATIKDVAERAGVSLSTVSIVANGRGDARKISPATQERVRQAMREVGYVPNAAARTLRGGLSRPSVALFWADDFREAMLARFLDGLHVAMETRSLAMDISIQPYRNGALRDARALAGVPSFDGAIVANANESDLAYLADYEPLAPMVLYNRRLEGYPCVYVDDGEIGEQAAALVAERLARVGGGAPHVACLCAPPAFEGMRVREASFCEALRAQGVEVREAPLAHNSAAGGYEAARAMDLSLLDAVFAPSDAVAFGVLHRASEEGVDVPGELGIVAVGNGIAEYAQHSVPPLTCVNVPMEDMAAACLELLLSRMGGGFAAQRDGLSAGTDKAVRVPTALARRASL